MAAKTTVKLMFPLVVFIFPSMFIVLFGPAALTISRNLGALVGSSRLRREPSPGEEEAWRSQPCCRW